MMIYKTEDNDDFEVYEYTGSKEKVITVYYNNGYADGSGSIELTKDDLEKMLELIK